MSMSHVSTEGPAIVLHARWVILAVPVVVLLGSPVYVATGTDGPPGNPYLAALLAVIAVVLQIWHSMATPRRGRPLGWQWTLTALTLLTLVPITWWGWNWVNQVALLAASLALLLRPWLATVTVAATFGAVLVAAGFHASQDLHFTHSQVVFQLVLWTVALLAQSGGLFAAARLASYLEDLHAARTELAELAIGRERLRVSRDLHDLLGQSLSAVSLKGDLALRLLAHEPDRARAEIQDLTGMARTALRDVRAITRDEHHVSLRAEIDAAVVLLEAAGIEVNAHGEVPNLRKDAQAVLAWAVREGTTNILRHSNASKCSVELIASPGWISLEMVNDRANDTANDLPGFGLVGLEGRAIAVGGKVASARTVEGGFRLNVEVPREGQ